MVGTGAEPPPPSLLVDRQSRKVKGTMGTCRGTLCPVPGCPGSSGRQRDEGSSQAVPGRPATCCSDHNDDPGVSPWPSPSPRRRDTGLDYKHNAFCDGTLFVKAGQDSH
ncbi:hypothetical protein DPEC_G00245850 [Dallia pectoralis]|uniref:Uncharacterized protein n=1 Tax=Dallia pectoralis TaxID=75939 RepID=A0ACC2FVU5_DALPE|nr:hypothetical protein DPEC_G00245850 [Dallia pectoralis]